jgi:hypothetical protein
LKPPRQTAESVSTRRSIATSRTEAREVARSARMGKMMSDAIVERVTRAEGSRKERMKADGRRRKQTTKRQPPSIGCVAAKLCDERQ